MWQGTFTESAVWKLFYWGTQVTPELRSLKDLARNAAYIDPLNDMEWLEFETQQRGWSILPSMTNDSAR